ncbi:MAG: hypothetical protein ACYCQI_14395 [Gammaproteobacteria bacterium]
MKKILAMSCILTACLSSFAFASSCNDFDVLVKNRSGENLLVILQTPNHGQKALDVENGAAAIVDTAVNEGHDDTWAYVEIYRYNYLFLNPILIFQGTLVKGMGGSPINQSVPPVTLDANYKIKSEKLSDGFCQGHERGQWKYTVTR